MRIHSTRSNLMFYNIREENKPNENETVTNNVTLLGSFEYVDYLIDEYVR